MDLKRICPWHIIIKTLIKNNERVLKAPRKNIQGSYKGIHIRIILAISVETLKARRTWAVVPAETTTCSKFSIIIDGENKQSSNKI